MPSGDVELKFQGGKEPLRFSQVREQYLLAYGWRGAPAPRQRKRLYAMRREFVKLKRAFARVKRGETIQKVAGDLGVSVSALGNWLNGKTLPHVISTKQISFNVGKRLHYLNKAAVKNPRIGYVMGARVSGHLVVHTDKRGQVTIASTVKKGSVENELARAQKEVFGYRVKERTRDMSEGRLKKSIAVDVRASSVEIAQFLNEATFFGRHIPRKFLKTRTARKEFAMALIDSGAFPVERRKPGRVKQTKGIIFRSKNRDLRDYFHSLLKEFGVKSNPREGAILSHEQKWTAFQEGTLHRKGARYGLFIPQTELVKFRRKLGFRDSAKAKTLDRFIAG